MVVYICIEQIISYYANFIPTIDSDRAPKAIEKSEEKDAQQVQWKRHGHPSPL